MIVRRVNDIEPIDVSKLLNTPDMGIKLRWLVHNQVGDESYGHQFAFRHFTIEPGKSFPMHHHKYVEAVYILSGKCAFRTATEEVKLEPGDLVYTSREEPHALIALGDDPLILTCCIDCMDGGENCNQVIPE